jgi:hypothetical protein
MKKIIAALVILACVVVVAVAAGPFGIFGNRRGGNCGPNGCQVAPAPQPEPAPQLASQRVIGGDVPMPKPKPKAEPKKAVCNCTGPENCTCVGGCACEQCAAKEEETNFGLSWAKLTGEQKITMNGHEITMQHAMSVMDGQIPDDSKKLRLVVIGTPEHRKPVQDAYLKMDQEFKDRVAPWFVAHDHYSLKDTTTGETIYVASGKPTVYLQCPTGKVLHRQDDFTGFGDFEAIRKAVKEYDAKKDPDLRKSPAPAAPNSNHALFLLGAGAAAFLVYHAKKK